MDKQTGPKSMQKILKFLPKAAHAAFLFQNPPFSPGRVEKPKTQANKGFSGPILIPVEARGKSENFEAQEPTSPKVSCMGQIKHKKRICKKQVSLPKGFKPERPAAREMKNKPSGLKKMLGSRRKSDESADDDKPRLPDTAPSLGQMRKFASSRDAFVNFDWTAVQIAPEEGDDVIIPFSAPILTAGRGAALEPKKEINLWKRRTMAQPMPLQLDMVKGSAHSKSK